jgi:hypothetical protein
VTSCPKALVITPWLSPPDLPGEHAYTLKPGRPTPGPHNLLRPPIASYEGIGLLTDFPSATRFRLTLGADSPCADERCAGNLGLSASRPFTCFIATHVSIRTSDTSSKGSPSPSQAYGTLSYRTRNPLSALSRNDSCFSRLGTEHIASAQTSPRSNALRWIARTPSFGYWLEPRYIFRAGRLDQ